MSTETATEVSMRMRANSYRSWGNTPDWSARTAPARAGLEDKFLQEAGGDLKRAEALKKAHFTDLARKSALARRRAKDHTAIAEAVEAELSSLGQAV